MGSWSSRSAKTPYKEAAVDDEAPLPAVDRDPNVMGGVPVFDWNRIVRSWPFVTPAHVEAARRYVTGHSRKH